MGAFAVAVTVRRPSATPPADGCRSRRRTGPTRRKAARWWLLTTPLGATDGVLHMAILPNGNVGIGTPQGPGGEPTATDRLQVFGDMRVGTTGTNGCVKRFDGNGLVGTCAVRSALQEGHHAIRVGPAQSADRAAAGALLLARGRLSRATLRRRARLRADRAGGRAGPAGARRHGDDGYKAVDYSKLPLLTIQAVKELKADNDALRDENQALKRASETLERRLAELERLVSEVVARTERR